MRHRYGDHFHQFADLLLPREADGPLPVAVVLHPGFWRQQYSLDISEGLARDLAGRGWAAWNVEYRRVGESSGGGYPATLEDVAAAIDFLPTLDAPLDLERVVAIGHSAGGQLALWAAVRPDAAVPLAGVVVQAGVTDLRAAERDPDGEEAIARFVGGYAADVPERYADASPIERVPIGVPQLLVHGTEDVRVPVDMSRRYAEAAGAAGDDVTFAVRPGEDHFVHLDPGGGAWADVVGWLERFG